MDDIGTGVDSFLGRISSLREISNGLRRSGWKLSAANCELGPTKVSFLGNVMNGESIKPESKKKRRIFGWTSSTDYIPAKNLPYRLLHFFKAYLPNSCLKLLPFYKLLRKDVPIEVLNDDCQKFQVLCDDLKWATEVTLRLAEADAQHVFSCDSSYRGAGFVLKMEKLNATGEKKQHPCLIWIKRFQHGPIETLDIL